MTPRGLAARLTVVGAAAGGCYLWLGVPGTIAAVTILLMAAAVYLPHIITLSRK